MLYERGRLVKRFQKWRSGLADAVKDSYCVVAMLSLFGLFGAYHLVKYVQGQSDSIEKTASGPWQTWVVGVRRLLRKLPFLGP